MIQPESQVALTFYSRGALTSKGVEISEDGTKHKNAASKTEIKKMMAFSGAVDPNTKKFSKTIDVDYYVRNKQAFPKKYYWSKSKYIEPTYGIVTRKLKWNWDQIQSMLNTPVLVNDKQWKKFSDEKKLEMHAQQCLQSDEYEVSIEYIS